MLDYKLAWANANAAQEIFNFIEKSIGEAEGLEKKQKGEIPDLLRDGIS